MLDGRRPGHSPIQIAVGAESQKILVLKLLVRPLKNVAHFPPSDDDSPKTEVNDK